MRSPATERRTLLLAGAFFLALGRDSAHAKCFASEVSRIAYSTEAQRAEIVSIGTRGSGECALDVRIGGVELDGVSDSPGICGAKAGASVNLKIQTYCCDEPPCPPGPTREIRFVQGEKGGLVGRPHRWRGLGSGLVLTIEAPKAEYKRGEDIVLSFTIQNISDQPVHFLDPKEPFRTNFYSMEFADEGGKPIGFVPPEPADGAPEVLVDIAPGKWIRHEVHLDRWKLAGLGHADVEIGKEPRTIVVTGVYFTPVGMKVRPGTWLGMIRSSPIRIRIR